MHRVEDAKELQYRAITRDGKMKWLREHITMMTFPDAKKPVQLAVYTGVTDIAETKEKLAAQHDQIAKLLINTPSGIAIVEVNSNVGYIFRLCVFYRVRNNNDNDNIGNSK